MSIRKLVDAFAQPNLQGTFLSIAIGIVRVPKFREWIALLKVSNDSSTLLKLQLSVKTPIRLHRPVQ